ncbi:MAG: CotH kinase family protein [Anaerolineae bacterium]|nr:CotH kinase family protein [Anaerolineae bacterium]
MARTAGYRRVEVASILIFLLVSLALLLANPASQLSATIPCENSPQVEALASCMPNQGWAPLTVYFSAFGSAAADRIVRYQWDLDGNGRLDTDATAAGGYARYTYSKPGDYWVTLVVTDDQGRAASDSLLVSVRHPASSSVDYWTIFDDSQVRRIDVMLTQADWERMWADPPAQVEVPADVVIFGERLDDVGFSMRGQFSLRESGAKKPWQIDTDAYVAGQEYRNLRRLVFTNNIGDPSLLQEKLAYDMMYFAGVPASHACFVEIWIDITDDDEPAAFWGVYTMVERVDRKFLANRFGPGNRDGNLYKASHAQRGPMDLVYYGPRIEDYPTQNGQYAYGKMTNEAAVDYSDVVQLCYVVDGAEYESPEAFAQALEEVLNVDSFLRYMAVVVTLSNWDIYPYTGNNYYLYHNPATGRFEWIPWDLAWGGDPRQPLFELDGPRLVPYAPLYERVFAVERYRRQYAAYLDLLSREWFTYEHVYDRASALHATLAPYVTQGTGDRMFFGNNATFAGEDFDRAWLDLPRMAGERSDFILTTLAQGGWDEER